MNRSAVGAVAAQGVQALASFVLQIAVARTLGISALGAFAILYGVVTLASAMVTGFVGDSLVVLDRKARPIRAALEQYALLLALGGAVVAGAATTLLGLTAPLEGAFFALAVALFCLEEVVRRTLMADLRFWRVALIDGVGLVVTMTIVGLTALGGVLELGSFLAALAAGQAVALVAGFVAVPAPDRFLVPFVGGGRKAVAAYGVWRSLQQFLRPALLTAVRSTVGLVAGLAATGLLEAARTYTAPALLLVSGLSSYLFASFARSKDVDVRTRLRRADRAVLALLGLTAAVAVVAIVLLPFVGRTLFTAQPDIRAVVGWLAYTASVAAVTPYGALAAVSGGQAAVFAVRATDTVVSLAAVVVGLLLGMDPAWSAALLAVGSLGGGLVLRWRAARTGRPARRLPRRPRLAPVLGAGGAVVLIAGVASAAMLARPPVPAPSPPAPAPSAEAVHLLGSGPAARPDSDGRRWTDALPSGTRLDVVGGAGYAGTPGAAMAASVSRIAPDAATVVLVSGAADRSVPSLRLVRAVSGTIRAVQRRAPHAAVVVVGPLVADRELPADLARVRAVLRATAASDEATFVDPVQEKWFTDGRGLTADGSRLTPVGASRLITGLRPLIAT